MAVDFSNFTQKTKALSTDFVVGYDANVSKGEKKYTLSTIANAVSGIMENAIKNLINEETITLSAPTGSIIYYASTNVPSGWDVCNGFTVTTALGPNYTALRNFLIAGGYKFGSSGSDPKVPDLRGKFIRTNGSDGTNTSANFGVTQRDAFQGHEHISQYPATIVDGDNGSDHLVSNPTFSNKNTIAITSKTGYGTPRIATETRPANIALLACIKL